MEAIDSFRQVYQNRHEYAREWRQRNGGKVVGYFCTYVPEELLFAGGTLPVRVLGSHEPPDIAAPNIFDMFCPFCRDCLAQGLKGKYDYLDGIMIAQSCLHMRQTFSSWQLHVPVAYSYYLYMPHGVQSPRAKPYLAGELADFQKSLEGWLGKTISPRELDRAIEVYNTNRRLMKQVYQLRKAKEPPLTGTEAMLMVLASQLMDKAQHNSLLEQALQELPQRKPQREAGVRLMIVGSENDDTPFMEMVESLGATFVIDDHCTGSRYFWDEVTKNGDLISALANRYVDRVPCPSKDWPERARFPHILKLAKEYDVQAAFLIQQKFCDPHEMDTPALRDYLEKNGIPTYFLEFDVTVPVGQFRTRVEAFLETLRGELLY